MAQTREITVGDLVNVHRPMFEYDAERGDFTDRVTFVEEFKGHVTDIRNGKLYIRAWGDHGSWPVERGCCDLIG